MKNTNFYFGVLDLETGGLSHLENPITEIAIQIVNPSDFSVVDKYETLVKPYGDLKIEQKALDKTGLTIERLEKEGLLVDTAISHLKQFISSYTVGKSVFGRPRLIGHNLAFDINFLKLTFNLFDLKFTDLVFSSGDEAAFFDTQRFSELLWNNLPKDEIGSVTLAACCKRAGIEILGAHRAINDVDATRKLAKFFSSLKDNISGVQTEQEEKKSRKFFQF